jgi:hypothetical protein
MQISPPGQSLLMRQDCGGEVSWQNPKLQTRPPAQSASV